VPLPTSPELYKAENSPSRTVYRNFLGETPHRTLSLATAFPWVNSETKKVDGVSDARVLPTTAFDFRPARAPPLHPSPISLCNAPHPRHHRGVEGAGLGFFHSRDRGVVRSKLTAASSRVEEKTCSIPPSEIWLTRQKNRLIAITSQGEPASHKTKFTVNSENKSDVRVQIQV
jgi:hypothetical protein